MKNLTLLFGILTLVLTGCSSGNNSEQNQQDPNASSDSVDRTMHSESQEEGYFEASTSRHEQRLNRSNIPSSCLNNVSLSDYHALLLPIEVIPSGGAGTNLIYLNLPSNIDYDTCIVEFFPRQPQKGDITEIKIITKNATVQHPPSMEKFEIKLLDNEFNPAEFVMVTVYDPSGTAVEKTEYYTQHNTPQIQSTGTSNTVGMQQLNADIIIQNCHNSTFSDYVVLMDMPEEDSYSSTINSAKGQIALGLPDGTDLKELITTVRTLDNGDQCLTFDLKVETGLQTTGNRMLIFEREVTQNIFDQIEAYAVQVFELSDNNPKKKKVLKSKVGIDPSKFIDALIE